MGVNDNTSWEISKNFLQASVTNKFMDGDYLIPTAMLLCTFNMCTIVVCVCIKLCWVSFHVCSLHQIVFIFVSFSRVLESVCLRSEFVCVCVVGTFGADDDWLNVLRVRNQTNYSLILAQKLFVKGILLRKWRTDKTDCWSCTKLERSSQVNRRIQD